MTRFAVLAALALAALLPAPVSAQLAAPVRVLLVDASADKDKLTWTEIHATPVVKKVVVKVNINGKDVEEVREVLDHEYVQVKRQAEFKSLKATDAAGKVIAADKLAELLKTETPVVMLSGARPLSDKHRGLFKDKVVFIELLPPGPPLKVVPPKK